MSAEDETKKQPVAEGEEEEQSPHTPHGNETRIIQAECGEMNELESLCPKCGENGITRMMLTLIPHFREIIVSSFTCSNEECGEQNRNIEFGGAFGPKHVKFELKVDDKKDLNRQVIKSEFATIYIPELDLEIPPGSQKGVLQTVEGVLATTIDGLQSDQPVRKIMHPEVAEKIDVFCEKIRGYQELKEPFTLVLDDPAGNSYIEAIHDYYHPTIDNKMVKIETFRTNIERQLLGLPVEHNEGRTAAEEKHVEDGQVGDEVIEIPLACPACTSEEGMLRTHKCDIPYFKETLIMCFKCDKCGYKSTEIKNGGGVAPKGCKKVLKVVSESDMRRDVLKSDSCALEIPEIQLELAPGTLGGFFTTVEGLLAQVHEHLSSVRQIAFDEGDAQPYNSEQEAPKMKTFLASLKNLQEGNGYPFTIIMDDPLANVYIQNPKAHLAPPENEDPNLTSEEYERTAEMNDDLGITSLMAMKAEEDAKKAAAVAATAPTAGQ